VDAEVRIETAYNLFSAGPEGPEEVHQGEFYDNMSYLQHLKGENTHYDLKASKKRGQSKC
jgi:hypothetical protein